MSFQRAVAFVLRQEGAELVNDPNDPGGLSRYGIALAKHPELTAADIREMTPERAATIYRTGYWAAIRGDDLPEWVQLPLLDAAVNQGPTPAIRALQRALYLPADGQVGPKTITALGAANPNATLAGFVAERIADYSALRTWARFGKGWARRAALAALEAI